MTISEYVNRDPDLLNCPCCGGIGLFIHQNNDESVDYGQIFCSNGECFICTPYGKYEKCKSIWNKRVDWPKHLLEWL